jgi:magnesium transporter
LKIQRNKSTSLPEIHLNDPVLTHARKDFASFKEGLTVEEALASIREHGLGERIIYFYVLDETDRLAGVLPTRRLLSAKPAQKLSQIMVDKIISIPHTVSVLDACEWFVMHKLLAFPVVDEQRRMLGVVDVSLFTQEILDLSEREQSNAVFETLGVHISQVKNASPWRAFRFRFPWLLATISGGVLCALLTSFFELTLAQSLILAFFLTLMLGLGESVSMQSMTVAVMTLHHLHPDWSWYLRSLRREISTALLLGGSSGLVVGLIVWLWWGQTGPAIVIVLSIILSLSMACILGLSIPALLHTLQYDPKIAAGPLTLAIADLFTLFFYFSLAAILL